MGGMGASLARIPGVIMTVGLLQIIESRWWSLGGDAYGSATVDAVMV